MKVAVALVTEKISNVRRFVPKVRLSNNNFVQGFNVGKSENIITEFSVPKVIKNIIHLFKPKEFLSVQSSIIAKIETPYGRFDDIPDPKDLKYGSVDRIMAEIYSQQAQTGYPGYTVNHNIEQLRHVPDAVKDLIKPLDVRADGHIDQNTINKAYNIAKKAGKVSPYEYPPTFAGKPDLASEAQPTLGRGSLEHLGTELSAELPADISGGGKFIEALDSRFKIFDGMDSNIEIDSEHLTDLTSNVSDAIDSDILHNIVKKSGDVLGDLLDSISDLH